MLAPIIEEEEEGEVERDFQNKPISEKVASSDIDQDPLEDHNTCEEDDDVVVIVDLDLPNYFTSLHDMFIYQTRIFVQLFPFHLYNFEKVQMVFLLLLRSIIIRNQHCLLSYHISKSCFQFKHHIAGILFDHLAF